jgi:hypothetical protein
MLASFPIPWFLQRLSLYLDYRQNWPKVEEYTSKGRSRIFTFAEFFPITLVVQVTLGAGGERWNRDGSAG